MNNSNQISLEDLRGNLSDVINRVSYRDDLIVIKKYNKDTAIIMSPKEYERLLDPTKRLSGKERAGAFQKLNAIKTQMPDVEPEQIKKDVNEAIKQVRAER